MDKTTLKTIAIGAAIACSVVMASAPASATPFFVQAQANSSSGGAGLASITLTTGEVFKVSSSLNDLWSAGALPRYSDGNGLTGNRFATSSDDLGQAPGTLIGQDFGLWGQHSINAPFGTLVGEIGGVYQALGANFTGAAWGTGTLNLYYWDSNFGDNTGGITFNVRAAPEPASLAVLGMGLLGAAALRRRKSKKA